MRTTSRHAVPSVVNRYVGDVALDELCDHRIRVESRLDVLRRSIAMQLEHGRSWTDASVVELCRQLRAARVEHALLVDAERAVHDMRAEQEPL